MRSEALAARVSKRFRPLAGSIWMAGMLAPGLGRTDVRRTLSRGGRHINRLWLGSDSATWSK
jgi:hypothetical protein